MGAKRKPGGAHITTGRAAPALRTDAQVQAHVARTSHIHSRLMATLDTVDAMKSSHAFVLTSERQAKQRLSDKLDRYIDFVDAAQRERDDLLDAVNVFLEKDPLNVKQTGRADHTEDSYAYATAIISTLRIERDREREAHQKTAKDAEARIAFLEAKLARREAELEECILHTPQCFPLPETSAVMPNPVDGITEHDAVKIMDNTFVKNKVLEAEVKTLADRLDQVRKGAFPASVGSSIEPATTSQAVSTRIEPPSVHVIPEIGPTVPDSPPLPPPTDADKTIKSFTPFLFHSGLPPSRSRSPPVSVTGCEADAPLEINHALDRLDHEINVLGSRVSHLRVERDRLRGIIGRNQHTIAPAQGDDPDTSQHLLSLEDEGCTQGYDSEQRADTFNPVERDILDDLSSSSSHHSEPTSVPDDELDGELTMELATPLQPSILLFASPLATSQGQYTDPPSIPLPDSPSCSPPMSPGGSVSGTQLRQVDVERLERELEAAREHVQESWRTLNELRLCVEELIGHGLEVQNEDEGSPS